MSVFDCSLIFEAGIFDEPLLEVADDVPRIRLIRLARPFSPNSSAMTRSAESEAMKFTACTRLSRATASSKCRRKIAPLAPVVAIVRFCGGLLGKRPPGEAWRASTSEHRE